MCSSDLMIHRKVFDTIGLLNEDYGVGGGEDTEFSIETERAGFEVCQTVDKQWSPDGDLYVGDFPLYHKGEGTMHDTSLVPHWNQIFEENSLRLAKKYNPEWYHQRMSYTAPRSVFIKGQEVAPREKARYTFAGQSLSGPKVLDIGCSSGFGFQFLPQGVDYTGIDNDLDIINCAKEQAWGDRKSTRLNSSH